MSQSVDLVSIRLARLLNPVVACFTPEVAKRIVELDVDPEVQARVAELAERCNEGILTPEETHEYDAYMQTMDVIAVLQQQARTLLVAPHAS